MIKVCHALMVGSCESDQLSTTYNLSLQQVVKKSYVHSRTTEGNWVFVCFVFFFFLNNFRDEKLFSIPKE